MLWLWKGPQSEPGDRVTEKCCVQSKIVSYLQGRGDKIWAAQGDRAVPRWVKVVRSGGGYLGISAS